MLHVVDFDGAIEYSKRNFKIIEDICSAVIIPVEFTGGIRTADDVRMILDAGVSRLALATMAIENTEEFIKVFNKYGPTKIVVSLDIIDNEIILRGKRQD
jgi:phosphoribosylformimino-5-aminoimidazole carboxamide ribotide isomerase